MIEWRAREYEYYEKDWIWYAAVLSGGLAVFFIAVWERNFLLAVFTVVAVLMVIVWGKRYPRLVAFKLDGKELVVGRESRSLMDFEGFSIKGGLLMLKVKGRLGGYLKIKIDRRLVGKIKKELQKRLPEVEYEEPLTEALMRWLRF